MRELFFEPLWIANPRLPRRKTRLRVLASIASNVRRGIRKRVQNFQKNHRPKHRRHLAHWLKILTVLAEAWRLTPMLSIWEFQDASRVMRQGPQKIVSWSLNDHPGIFAVLNINTTIPLLDIAAANGHEHVVTILPTGGLSKMRSCRGHSEVASGSGSSYRYFLLHLEREESSNLLYLLSSRRFKSENPRSLGHTIMERRNLKRRNQTIISNKMELQCDDELRPSR